jgi:hypothetical protein
MYAVKGLSGLASHLEQRNGTVYPLPAFLNFPMSDKEKSWIQV